MPRVCPSPNHHPPWHDPDCPLYAQRLDYGQDEPLRRAILTERHRLSLGSLVWADLNRQCQRAASAAANWPSQPTPATPPTRPVLPPAKAEPLPIFDLVKGAMP
jgi:hypothetical protein